MGKSSSIRFTENIDSRTFELRLDLDISSADLASVNLSDFDRALLDDIENGIPSNTPIADKLLGLETLVRRIEEQRGSTEIKER